MTNRRSFTLTTLVSRVVPEAYKALLVVTAWFANPARRVRAYPRCRVFVPLNAVRLVVAPRRIAARKVGLRPKHIEHPLGLLPLDAPQPWPQLGDYALDVASRGSLPPVHIHRCVPLDVRSADVPGADNDEESRKDLWRTDQSGLRDTEFTRQVTDMCAVLEKGAAALAVVQPSGPWSPLIARHGWFRDRRRQIDGPRELQELYGAKPRLKQV